MSSIVTPCIKCSLGQTKWWAVWAAARGAKLQGALRRHWDNGQHGAGKLRFPLSKEFFPKIIHSLGSRPKKNVCQLRRWRNKFTEYGFKGALLCLGQARNAGEQIIYSKRESYMVAQHAIF